MEHAKPKSHGNYVESLEVAEKVIQDELDLFGELDADDIPAFTLVIISDGKPSDTLPDQKCRRNNTMTSLANSLKSKLTFLGMGIGSARSDFADLLSLADIVTSCDGEGKFVHAGLNATSISTTLTSIATSMTATRNDLLSKRDQKTPKTEKVYIMKHKNLGVQEVRREINGVTRYLYDPKSIAAYHPWRKVDFINNDATGFEVEKNPFGLGAERLAHMFYEIKQKSHGWERVGRALVAKESRYIQNEESKEKIHTSFCKVQHEARSLAHQFNKAVQKAPMLKPLEDEKSTPPPIEFLKCSIYEFKRGGMLCGLLVEKFLSGRFMKYNGNFGYVNNNTHDGVTISLEIGDVKLTDFIQAFSHWVYENSNHNRVVCDLQGILDLEGRVPIFRLTDPVICSKGKERNRYGYGKTDLGRDGIRQFCLHHKCNSVCKGLSLPLMRAK